MDEPDPLAGAGGPVHRDRRLRPVGRVGPGDRVRVQVDAVVDVQVAEADGVDVEEPGVLLQRAESAVAEVDDEAEPVRLEEVTRCGAVRPGKAPGTTHHGKTHVTNLGPELTLEALLCLLE